MSLEYITDHQKQLGGWVDQPDEPETFAVGIDLQGSDIRRLDTVQVIEELVVGDCCADLEVCELDRAELEEENEELKNANEALELAAQDEESVGSEGNRISVATHIFDYNNAATIQTDVWKYELWTIMSPGNPFIEFNLRKTAISRDPTPGFPEQSGIRMVRPDATTFDQGSYIQSLSSTPSGLLNVGDVWTFQYVFEDALNYLGDPNIINTGYIDVFTVTIIKDISTGFVPGEIYVRIDVKAIGETYDTKSGATSP